MIRETMLAAILSLLVAIAVPEQKSAFNL